MAGLDQNYLRDKILPDVLYFVNYINISGEDWKKS
jgi:hypothetical protein